MTFKLNILVILLLSSTFLRKSMASQKLIINSNQENKPSLIEKTSQKDIIKHQRAVQSFLRTQKILLYIGSKERGLYENAVSLNQF